MDLGNDMNSWKVMQAQAKYMKDTWQYSCGIWVHDKFTISKKCSSGQKYPNTLVASAVTKALKIKADYKSKDMEDFNLDTDLEHFNFENLDTNIKSDLERDHGHGK